MTIIGLTVKTLGVPFPEVEIIARGDNGLLRTFIFPGRRTLTKSAILDEAGRRFGVPVASVRIHPAVRIPDMEKFR